MPINTHAGARKSSSASFSSFVAYSRGSLRFSYEPSVAESDAASLVDMAVPARRWDELVCLPRVGIWDLGLGVVLKE